MIEQLYGKIEELLNEDKSVTNENGNKDSKVFNTKRDLLAGIVAKNYALENILPKHIAEAHIKGEIHIHDLDYSPFFNMFNCFSGDTKFISTKGVKSFNSYQNGEQVIVPTHNGEWKKAIVKSYGIEMLNRIILKRGQSKEKIVYATKNHRWLLNNNTITSNICVGDKLIKTPNISHYDFHNSSLEEKMQWVKGFVYADGTNSNTWARIRLCGRKNIYSDRFKEVGFPINYPKCLNGDALINLTGMVKELPNIDSMSHLEIKAWIDGYLSADGSVNYGDRGKNKFFGVQITGEKDNDIIAEMLQVAGHYISTIRDMTDKDTNYGKRTAITCFYQIAAEQSYRNWKVKEIQPSHYDEVWCLEVEDNNSFILDGGIVTGNCMLIDYEGMLKNGFTIGNADVERPKSIATATALMAQIVANVSSNIYGGTTFSRVDEVLEPYAKISYLKHLNEAEKWIEDKVKQEEYAKHMTIVEIHDSMQSLEYEINTLFNSNGQ